MKGIFIPDITSEMFRNGCIEEIEALMAEGEIYDIECDPSAQPEIIRCKDCKYARLTYDGSCKYCDIWFPDEAEYMDGDYYCASAERKGNG